MSHSPIVLKDLSFILPHKTCFAGFSSSIHAGKRIAIIGQNGCGKSTLLKILQGLIEPTDGEVAIPKNLEFGYVEQVITDLTSLSGAQRFNAMLSQALSNSPQVLCLDEPTNHLDRNNRKSLMRMLQGFDGTLIVVTHDVEFLCNCIDELWHIESGKIHIFNGAYDDYMYYRQKERNNLAYELAHLEKERKQSHLDLMREQERAHKSKVHGEKKYADDKMALRSAQGRGQLTHSKNKRRIGATKDEIMERLAGIRLTEIITPKFSLSAQDIGNQAIVSVSEGQCGYNQPIIRDISLHMNAADRLAISGNNGSGKSTLIKALMGKPEVCRSGEWYTPKVEDIGYLDQHYATLDHESTPYTLIANLVPSWTPAEIRRHLNDYLFRKNEEVNSKVHMLSGGEKMRLSLALISAKTPRLLILDEVTNNLDLETRAHMIAVLRAYPGGLIIISHDEDFLAEIGISCRFHI